MIKHDIQKSWLAMPLVGLVAGIPLGYMYAIPGAIDAASQYYRILPGVEPAGGSGPIYVCNAWHHATNQWGLDIKRDSGCYEPVGTEYPADVVGSGSKKVYGDPVAYNSGSGCTGIGLALYTSSSYSSSSYLGTVQYVHIRPSVSIGDRTNFNPMGTSFKAGIGTVLGQETSTCSWSGPHLHQAYLESDGWNANSAFNTAPVTVTFNNPSDWFVSKNWTTPK